MLYLASKSPRRRQLLEQLGERFECLDVEVPEQRAPGEAPAGYVDRVAREKAGAGLLALAGVEGAIVLGADTEVILGDEVFGKPADADEAAAMLRRLSGRAHEVVSVVWAVSAGREAREATVTRVHVDALDEAAIAGYVASGECFGKAGAYAIQGRFARHVPRIEGSYTGVVGLPAYETARLIDRMRAP